MSCLEFFNDFSQPLVKKSHFSVVRNLYQRGKLLLYEKSKNTDKDGAAKEYPDQSALAQFDIFTRWCNERHFGSIWMEVRF